MKDAVLIETAPHLEYDKHGLLKVCNKTTADDALKVKNLMIQLQCLLPDNKLLWYSDTLSTRLRNTIQMFASSED